MLYLSRDATAVMRTGLHRHCLHQPKTSFSLYQPIQQTLNITQTLLELLPVTRNLHILDALLLSLKKKGKKNKQISSSVREKMIP